MSQENSLLDWLHSLGISKELNNNDILSGITLHILLGKLL